MRSVVAYDDLPHASEAVERAANAKRRRRTHEAPYVGPHWDDAQGVEAKQAEEAPWNDEPSTPPADVYDSDDAVVASPHADTHALPFLSAGVDVPTSSHTLTAADVWDDAFLVDVWNAAEQEYLDFHARRTDALEKESMWHALPHVGTRIPVPPPRPPSPELELEPDAEPAPQEATRGWLRARQIVRTTPNSIGGPRQLGGADFERAAMAWYYAGYYTAAYQHKHTSHASST